MSEAFALFDLDRLPITVDRNAVEAAMRPFQIDDPGGRIWRRVLARRCRKTLWRAVKRLFGVRRDKKVIVSEYGSSWSRGHARYDTTKKMTGEPWVWRTKRILFDNGGAARMRSVLFAAVIDAMKPASILEVGSGNGINLLSLAGAYPEIELIGVDLTEEGIAQARKAQSGDILPPELRQYSPLPSRDSSAHRRIRFSQADASRLPFEDDSFDMVLTVLAVEQMERIRPAALREIARVVRRHVLMLEPFRDANATGLRRAYVYSRDYFRGSIAGLADFGLKPLWATDDFPQEVFLGTALVLSEKRSKLERADNFQL